MVRYFRGIQYQWYWSWWPLIYFSSDVDQYGNFEYRCNVLCIGPLQMRWMGSFKRIPA